MSDVVYCIPNIYLKTFAFETNATMEGRIANLYKAAEKAAQISLLQIQRTVLYKFKLNVIFS